ncbi:hypothetical protein [Nocardioides sp. R-C-SC26]|uniref:hypothetical protein n=1 Tax=Nocardioides sp. R-C-SC26 TaxID=2870414 RepID=UPI001E34CA68|nr:hypothetical protein [Nocardioides sp. R-C-SC26]
MTMHIDPRRCRVMAADYEDAVAGYAGYEFPDSGVSGSSFGDVDLAVWFTAITEQFDAAGLALHAKGGHIANGLRQTATAVETADDDAVVRSEQPLDELSQLLLGQPVTPQPSGLESLLLDPINGTGTPSTGPYGGL